jgi:GNAT superfamily N-acetyltransferase
METETNNKIERNQETVDEPEPVIIRVATTADAKYAFFIAKEMADSAVARGSGIGHRSIEFLCQKMESGEAIIAVTASERWVGFSYIEKWQDGKFISNSGMIVSPPYRRQGVATGIKKRIFELSRQQYPTANIFSITTGLAIMKLNSSLGFKPVTYSEITSDQQFWDKCQHCVNYSTLQSKIFKNCFCTAMLFDAAEAVNQIVCN